MNKLIMAASSILIGASAISAANAQTVADPGPYLTAPVSDETLASSSAMALPAFSGHLRALSDQNANLYLDQVAEGSRISMDNWWSQTGAALITNNLLTMPPR